MARTVLFLPQVIPLVAAGIAWSWLLSSTGLVNQVLSRVGLGGVTRAWLGDFSTALPAVGVIGAWVLLGLCTLLLLAGMSKIDPALYEAARIDGAGPLREFFSITVPSLRQEIGGLRHGDRDRRSRQLRHRLHLDPGRPRQRDHGARPRDLLPGLLRTAGRAWRRRWPWCSWCSCSACVLPIQWLAKEDSP